MTKVATSAGIEPAIFGSVDRRVIRCATRPLCSALCLVLYLVKQYYINFREDFAVANKPELAMKTESEEVCYSGEGGPANSTNMNDHEEEVSSFFANQILGSISRLLSANGQADEKSIMGGAVDNSSESDEMTSMFDNIFNEHVESPFNEPGTIDYDGPKAKKARDDLGNAREDWPMKESGSSMTIPMPMCIRLVELYRRCRAFLRTFSQKKEDRKARHQMWDAIDARLFEEFGIHSGVNRLKKKIQNIQAGARGKIEALRRETSNGIVPQDTNIRFTPAEMEMVRMLYQNGDKALNTVNENNEPFYMQLEALMRRESGDKKIQIPENSYAERSLPTSNPKSVIFPNLLINYNPENGNIFSQIVSLISKPFDVLSAAANFSKTGSVPTSNGGHETTIMTELFTRQMNVVKRQEELQQRAELLFEQQLARESKLVDSIATITKAASHLEQIAELLLSTYRCSNVNAGTFIRNRNPSIGNRNFCALSGSRLHCSLTL
ncbi:unnamed protein product [Thelazia callipaeda]|uniref:Regulatory protein zeste n=1 Tax=Thelazia callipaeda TaxID=103827 RepID=A0A158RC51_THECL|nr:unnamed protein product [Thelazia callipaeda]